MSHNLGVNLVRQKYLKFFEDKDHHVTPSAPIVPENDPTTLFIGSGMQPMINYFLGEKHPLGTRITNSQKCFRAEDINEVGDNRHTTVFEMLGNWSFGDYFKAEQLPWIYQFFTSVIGLNTHKLYVSVFGGDDTMPKDELAIKLWQELLHTNKPAQVGEKGFDKDTRIYLYDNTKNWWSRSGPPDKMPVGEPGGTTSEVFYDFGEKHQFHSQSKWKDQPCHLNCDCGRFMEIGNSVFMEYKKEKDGSFSRLPEKNIDFGGGLERIAAAAIDSPDVFMIDFFKPIIHKLEDESGHKYQNEFLYPMRVIADHLRGATIMIADGVLPSNKQQGYILRRLLRRSILQADKLGIKESVLSQLTDSVADIYQPAYPEIKDQISTIKDTINAEEQKFRQTLKKGLREFEKLTKNSSKLDGQLAFKLYETYGYPLEVSITEANHQNIAISPLIHQEFSAAQKTHQEQSRSTSKGMFKGGLADKSESITKYHTATHLLHQALRDILGPHVEQMGSNITNERLRFDFKHPQKLTDEEKLEIEQVINQKIELDLPVIKTTETKDKALESGALAFFRESYPDKVSVYTIGKNQLNDWYSKELCGGPHVSSTGKIGPVTIKKEQSVGAGIRRIYIVLADN